MLQVRSLRDNENELLPHNQNKKRSKFVIDVGSEITLLAGRMQLAPAGTQGLALIIIGL